MEELKTLKDLSMKPDKEIEKACDKIGRAIVFENMFELSTLKQEAIKWIKELTKRGILGDLNSSERHNENMGRKAQIKWIKYFFNIQNRVEDES